MNSSSFKKNMIKNFSFANMTPFYLRVKVVFEKNQNVYLTFTLLIIYSIRYESSFRI